MGLLTKEQMLDTKFLKTEIIEIEEWGGAVTIRELSAQDLLDCAKCKDDEDLAAGAKAQLRLGIVDEDGACIFTEEDIDGLMKQGNSVVTMLLKAIATLSGISPDALEETAEN